MAEGEFEEYDNKEAAIILSNSNFGSFLMSNEMSRIDTRFIGSPEQILLVKTKSRKTNFS